MGEWKRAWMQVREGESSGAILFCRPSLSPDWSEIEYREAEVVAVRCRCRGMPDVISVHDRGVTRYRVSCDYECFQGPLRDTRSGAVASWNERMSR